MYYGTDVAEPRPQGSLKQVMKRKIIPYDHSLRQKARNLRNISTTAEIFLWDELKGRKLKGYQFHRQVPLLKYIVDFYCYELQLAIEVDGPVHDIQKKYDSKRQYELEGWGIRFLRFTNGNIKNGIKLVLKDILEEIEQIENGSMS